MKYFRRLIVAIALAFLVVPALPAQAATDPFQAACTTGGSSASPACGNTGADPLTGPNGTLTKVTRLIAYIAGIVAIIVIIVAGIMYAISGGDPGKASEAKNAIIYSLVGVVIVVVAQGIIIFVINRL